MTRADELDARPADTAKELLALADCPIGLFMKDGELCLKTEYGNNDGRIDAYIVSSGEFFWGDHPQTIANQRRQLVTPIDHEELLRLSARQQASVEWERLTSIIRPMIESVCSDGGSDPARLAKAISDALLAEYDIFQKVEG